MSATDTSWTEYHTAGASVLTTAPTSASDTAGDVGALLVVTFLVAITVAALEAVLTPIARVGRTLMGTAGAVLLTVTAFVLLAMLVVA